MFMCTSTFVFRSSPQAKPAKRLPQLVRWDLGLRLGSGLVEVEGVGFTGARGLSLINLSSKFYACKSL